MAVIVALASLLALSSLVLAQSRTFRVCESGGGTVSSRRGIRGHSQLEDNSSSSFSRLLRLKHASIRSLFPPVPAAIQVPTTAAGWFLYPRLQPVHKQQNSFYSYDSYIRHICCSICCDVLWLGLQQAVFSRYYNNTEPILNRKTCTTPCSSRHSSGTADESRRELNSLLSETSGSVAGIPPRR